MSDSNAFHYKYSAKEQAEVKRIREKYVSDPDDSAEAKLERLRRLDNSVTQKGSAAALILGVIGTLILGVGMCCCLVWNRFLIGILIGLAGLIGVSFAYPLYSAVTRRERNRIAPEILRLTDELMK